MSRVGDIAKGIFDLITPDSETSRFTFRKFDGQALSRMASGTQASLGKNDVVVINLKINPAEVSFTIPKLTQKVPTSAPGKFVVFDWGTDLTSIGISGNTGILLPGLAQNGIEVPFLDPLKEIADKIDPSAVPGSGAVVSGEASNVAQNLMYGHMSYEEIIGMSPKYRTFKKLQDMYETFDADMDVLTLEMGEQIYRGYFMDFSFSIIAETPWNWKYSMTFIALTDLSAVARRGDSSFAKDNSLLVEE